MSAFNGTSDGLMKGSTVILGKIDGIVLRNCIFEVITEEKEEGILIIHGSIESNELDVVVDNGTDEGKPGGIAEWLCNNDRILLEI